MRLTDAVVSKPFDGVRDILGEVAPGSVISGGETETIGITPTANGHADLRLVIEESANFAEGLERNVHSGRVRGKKGRVCKGCDGVGDASRERLVREQLGVVLVIVHDIARRLAVPRELADRGGGQCGQGANSDSFG